MDSHSAEFVGEVERLQALWNERPEEAVALARRLLEQAASGLPPLLPVVEATNLLGAFFSNRGFDLEARRACTLALEALQGAAEDDDALLARIHNNLGQLDHRAGELEDAERHLEHALTLRRGGSARTAEEAFTADNLGAVLAERGQLERAEQLHKEALQALQGLGPRYLQDLATVLGNLGLLYRRRGDFARARAVLLRAIDTHLRVSPLASGGAPIPLVNLAALLLEHGEEQRAEEMIDWLLRAAGANASSMTKHRVATGLLELGTAAFARAQLGAAERIATRAFDLCEAIFGSAAKPTLRALQLLANVHAQKGNVERAEQSLLHLLAMPGSEPEKTAELLIDLGKILRERGPGSFPAAIGMFERAIRLLRAQERAEPRALASALGNLGFTQFLRDDVRAAEALYDEALALGDARVLGNEYAWLLYNRALLHYHLAQHDLARNGMSLALRHWRRRLGPSHAFIATVHANLALVHWARGDFRSAQRAFAHAQELRAGDLERTLLVGTERERLEAAQGEQGELNKLVSFCFAAGARGSLARATAELLLQRKAGVLDALAMTYGRAHERVDGASRQRLQRIAQLRARISELALSARLFGDSTDPRKLAALQAEEDRLQTELSHDSAIGAGVLEPVTLKQVQGALPDDSVLVEYFRWTRFDPVRSGQGSPWREQHYAAMVLRGRGEPSWFDLGNAAGIDAGVQALRSLICDLDSDTAAITAAATELHSQIVAPFEPILRGASLVLVAPDGDLNLVPFGVLGEPMLAERFVLSHLTSGRELLRSAPPQVDPVVTVVVDPDFDAAVSAHAAEAPEAPATLNVEPLPGTRDEADVIASLFSRCSVLAGADANVDALKSIERPALLHIATHGVFMPVADAPPLFETSSLLVDGELLLIQRALRPAMNNPMLHAGLALAGANCSAPGRSAGFVTAAEVAALDLRGTELVVLSACDTGLGAIPPGGEFAGLRRAFAMAGAAAQVISLWEVDEDATTALMTSFYRHLLAGAGRAEALRRAQHEVRRRPRWAHPGAWAAFVAWGAWGPLSQRLRAASTEATT